MLKYNKYLEHKFEYINGINLDFRMVEVLYVMMLKLTGSVC